jgi:3-deoxy-manno-octulosonate cytidylyltransferase (CMP-KDO synthetase)
MSAIVVIPARFHSTRLPGKPLIALQNKPMIQHVFERAARARRCDGVYIATDSRSIFDAVTAFGGRAIMTSERHASGTDRIAEAVETLEREGIAPDIVVNVQGDEPLIMPDMIDEVIAVMDDARAAMGTLVKRIDVADDIANPNIVKAVFDPAGFALYFSRSPIPFHRDIFGTDPIGGRPLVPQSSIDSVIMYKHVGIYAYRRDVLKRFAGLEPARLETLERLEQLRALENGIVIKVRETTYETIGVDTPDDLERVKQCLSISS